MYILKADNLVKRYSGRTVVNEVCFDVSEGEIVGLLGRNGAGKTTSFRITVGMITPDSGQVVFNGRDVTKLPMYRRAQQGMGYLSQEPSVFQRLTVEQNLKAILETRPLSRAQRKHRAEELMSQFDLTRNRDQQARTLSGGERRKLEIARALITEPSLVLLDEPFSGVDPVAVEDLQREIRHLRDEHHIAMLVTDHNVQRTLEICDRGYIIADGRVFFSGTPKQIITDEQVRRLYLGSTFRGDEFDAEPARDGS
ncbi:MAG: LPS export ABC transporter ATP-binding protein [Phycisphaeraceae bacterium]|nr:LPS export ABC transporter ATP-binding protein [Phycisphaeraceae bacterium]